MLSAFVLLATEYGWEHTAIWSRQCRLQEWGLELSNRFDETRARLHSLATLLGDISHVEANDLLNKWTTARAY